MNRRLSLRLCEESCPTSRCLVFTESTPRNDPEHGASRYSYVESERDSDGFLLAHLPLPPPTSFINNEQREENPLVADHCGLLLFVWVCVCVCVVSGLSQCEPVRPVQL